MQATARRLPVVSAMTTPRRRLIRDVRHFCVTRENQGLPSRLYYCAFPAHRRVSRPSRGELQAKKRFRYHDIHAGLLLSRARRRVRRLHVAGPDHFPLGATWALRRRRGCSAQPLQS